MKMEIGKPSKARKATPASLTTTTTTVNTLDDGCLMHIFSFLSPIPDRYNTALVCHRWRYLACHPRLWLRVEPSIKSSGEPGVFPSLEDAISAARPGDTILIAAARNHVACNIQIKKPLCLVSLCVCLCVCLFWNELFVLVHVKTILVICSELWQS